MFLELLFLLYSLVVFLCYWLVHVMSGCSCVKCCFSFQIPVYLCFLVWPAIRHFIISLVLLKYSVCTWVLSLFPAKTWRMTSNECNSRSRTGASIIGRSTIWILFCIFFFTLTVNSITLWLSTTHYTALCQSHCQGQQNGQKVLDQGGDKSAN